MSGENVSDQLLAEISRVIAGELGKPMLSLTPQTTTRDVEGWDSLMHLQIISAIERRCKVRFSAMQIYNFNTVGDILAAIAVARASIST